MSILNIAAYRFVRLIEPDRWVAPLRANAERRGLKGTIIVATEGINLFLAGDEVDIESFVAWLASEPRFVDDRGVPALADLSIRRSWSAERPFRRLRVRHRPEIVTMRRPDVRPHGRRAPSIAPATLAAWLDRGCDDDGRPVVLLDARNRFEVDHGHFEGTRHLALDRFERFPDAVGPFVDGLRHATVVTYCTGGIRCEKAALHLRGIGLDNVVQLDGGILNYFVEVGGAHWRGDCFVFDERVALDAKLESRSPDSSVAISPSALRRPHPPGRATRAR